MPENHQEEHLYFQDLLVFDLELVFDNKHSLPVVQHLDGCSFVADVGVDFQEIEEMALAASGVLMHLPSGYIA